MTDIVIETLRAAILAGIFGWVVLGGRRYGLAGDPGWRLVSIGFGLLLFATVWDLTDNFESLGAYVIVGPTGVQLVFEKVFGYLAGALFVFAGLVRWLPLVGETKTARRELSRWNQELEARAAVDDTQRRRTEARLERASRLLRIAGRTARMGGWSVDLTNWMSEWSDEVCAIHEVPPGANPSVEEGINFYAPEWRGRIREAFGACARNGVPFDEELQIITASGKRKWVRAIGEPVRSESGAIVGVEGAFQDLTPAKEAEAALLLSERRFQQLAEALPQIVWTAEPDGTVDFISGDFYRLTGLGRLDLAARQWLEALHPDDRDRCVRVLADAVAAEEEFQTEIRVFSADDQDYRWHVTTGRPVRNETGAVGKWYGAGIDIHDRRLAEEALAEAQRRNQLILDAVGEGIHGLDAEGRLTFSNPAAMRILGYEAADLGERHTHELFHHHHADGRPYPLEECPIYRTLADGQTRHVEGEVFFRKDGSSVPVEYTCAPVIDEATGAITGTVTTFRDVTEQRRLEEELRQAQRLDAVGQLTGGVAHDFNNLLTVILGNAELMAEALPSSDPLRALAQTTRTAAERGAALTARLLAFARCQALDPRPRDVNRLIAGMDGLLRRTLGEQVEMEIRPASGLWTALVDDSQLDSAILNLCINARDAMPGGGRLTIETANARLDPDCAAQSSEVTPGEYVMIAVSDTGQGMDAATLARAFEPFFTTKEVGRGSGLGLSQVYGFVKQSKGHVRIQSEPGEGTSVRVYLPRACAEAPADEARAGGERTGGGGERILLVEDNDLVRDHVAATLKGLGYRLTLAGSGAEALAALERGEQADLLFTDVIMPGGMSGPELAERAQRLRPGLPVLFTSGYAESPALQQGLLEPGVNLLQKPYSRQHLAEIVRSALSKARQGEGAGFSGRAR